MYNPFFLVPDLDTHAPVPDGSSVSVFSDAEGNILCLDNTPVMTTLVPDFLTPSHSPPILIGSSPDINWWVYRIAEGVVLPPGYHLIHLRTISASLPRDTLGILGRAVHLARFDQITAFCGRCGGKTVMKSDELAKFCPSCGLLTFPRLSPAVIVRITRDDQILLARSPHFLPGMYSVLAGFIEPGESLEAGVHREVFEEVGVRITDLRYFGSQPWPFPDSLMIGFVARHLSGDIRCDGVEIEDAGWYSRNQMPGLPGPLSISRALIEDFLRGDS
jgi:NAD+ diphosphatase